MQTSSLMFDWSLILHKGSNTFDPTWRHFLANCLLEIIKTCNAFYVFFYVSPPLRLWNVESNKSKRHQTADLYQQMPEVLHGHLLARGHNKWRAWTTTEQERINIQIRRRKWGWIGHTLRKTNCNVIKQALRWNPQRKRSRGRPRNSWRRTVDDEASKAGYTWRQLERISQNRQRWRAMVSVDLCSTGSERV